VEEIFSPQYGEIIDLIAFQDSIVELNEWYQANGYVLAQVVAAPQVSPDGVVTLVVAEGVIESIQVRFLNDEGLSEDEEGNPVRGSGPETLSSPVSFALSRGMFSARTESKLICSGYLA
jgi:outer membrane protein insertion porin family